MFIVFRYIATPMQQKDYEVHDKRIKLETRGKKLESKKIDTKKIYCK